MILGSTKKGVPYVPYGLNPHHDWMEEGTYQGVLLGVPSLSCLSFTHGWTGHFAGDRTPRDTKKCPLSNHHQHWFFAKTGQVRQTGHLLHGGEGKWGCR